MATTIRIAKITRPIHATDSNDNADVVGGSTAVNNGTHRGHKMTRATSSGSEVGDDGIYNMRNLTRTFSRTSTKDKRGLKGGIGERELEDDDPGLRQSGDFKSRQVRSPTNPNLIDSALAR